LEEVAEAEAAREALPVADAAPDAARLVRDEAADAAEEARLEAEAATEEATPAADEARLEAEAKTEETAALAEDARDATIDEAAPAADDARDAITDERLRTLLEFNQKSLDCKYLRVVLCGSKASKDRQSDDGETHGDWLLV
jgi:hypothetical protein